MISEDKNIYQQYYLQVCLYFNNVTNVEVRYFYSQIFRDTYHKIHFQRNSIEILSELHVKKF